MLITYVLDRPFEVEGACPLRDAAGYLLLEFLVRVQSRQAM